MHRILDAIKHVIQGNGKVANFIAALSNGNPGLQVGSPDAGSCVRNPLHILQEPARYGEHQPKTEQDNHYPENHEIGSQVLEDSELLLFRQPEIDTTAILDAAFNNPKRNGAGAYVEIDRLVRK